MLLDYARSLLLLPRTLGANPETGEVVEVRNGKFGPYVLCGSSRRSLPKDFDPLLITLDDAMVLLEAASKTRAKRESAKILAEDMAAAHGDGQGSFAAPKPKTGRKKGTTALKVEEVAAEGLSRDTKGKRSRGPEAESEDDVVFLKPRSGYQFFLRGREGS